MALSRMLSTINHPFASRSDSFGIILRKSLVAKKQAKKVGLVNFLSRSIPFSRAQGSCFELCSRAGRMYKRFVQLHPPGRDRHCHFSHIKLFPEIFLF
jgi:hypothetical protein